MSTVVALREPAPETRVALVPEVVAGLRRAGHRVVVQTAAGLLALHTDADYTAAGAQVLAGADLAEALSSADALVHVRPLNTERIAALTPSTLTLGLVGTVDDQLLAALNAKTITALAFERLPRTSRAQSMDVLSSQALAAGYRAVLEAAIRLPRFFPLAMTAAGTVPPAKVVVLGVGVAGLQAIATARRLGAKVAANDIRPGSAEEVRSVGAEFIDIGVPPAADAGGYARDLDTEAADYQQHALAPHIAEADVLITTASVPGRPAPQLVTTEMVAAMRPGSVVVDLAAASGGNVQPSVAGQDVHVPCARGGGAVIVYGPASAPGDLAVDASRLFARNVAEVLTALTGPDGDLDLDLDDDVIAGMCLTHEGSSR